ncbi:restriction endonuclease subunit S, partial [Corynebacterium striatum]|uniref:restriction endonuclease subunit S n=1 Tax=Corynebacterium striatum TaxID=43770 RepID=UPI0025514E9A
SEYLDMVVDYLSSQPNRAGYQVSTKKRGSGPGKVGRLAEPAATNQACAAICIEDAVDADFLFYVLRNSYEQLRSLGRGGNQDNLNLSLVRDFRIPWPAVEIRQRFVAQMNEATRILTLLEKRNDALALLGKSLEQRYFSAS